MTDQISLSDLGAGSGDDGHRRDRWGRLLVVPPGGGKPIGYTRTTTVAKTTDEQGGLLPWGQTMGICGTLRHRGIHAQWEALIGQHGDPWYANAEAKAMCKRLAHEAAEAGGGGDRREQGNALHAITAFVDGGGIPKYLSPETQADVDAYQTTLHSYGISVIAGMIETTVVLDDWLVGGTFDRLVTVAGRELPMVADLKTGADISYSGGAFSIQIAGYAHANAIYVQGDTPADDVRHPMPEVDQHEGLIIWAPAGSGTCSIHVIDLDVGWDGFVQAMAVREWRKRAQRALAPFSSFQPIMVADVALDPEPSALAPVVQLRPDVSDDVSTHEEIEERERDAESLSAVREWLQGRIDVIGEHLAARVNLGQLWPQLDVPTLRASTAHTRPQLDAICRLLDDIEARHDIPFGATRPNDEELISRHFPQPE